MLQEHKKDLVYAIVSMIVIVLQTWLGIQVKLNQQQLDTTNELQTEILQENNPRCPL